MALVLVIDDEALVRATIRGFLESVGYRVIEAADGRRGLQQLAARSFDLVVVDIFMPEMEGLETIRAIRRLYGQLPVIAISGSAPNRRASYLKVAEEFGASATLIKPFSKDHLLLEVEHLLKPARSRLRGVGRG